MIKAVLIMVILAFATCEFSLNVSFFSITSYYYGNVDLSHKGNRLRYFVDYGYTLTLARPAKTPDDRFSAIDLYEKLRYFSSVRAELNDDFLLVSFRGGDRTASYSKNIDEVTYTITSRRENTFYPPPSEILIFRTQSENNWTDAQENIDFHNYYTNCLAYQEFPKASSDSKSYKCYLPKS